jgi:hypothetical protein
MPAGGRERPSGAGGISRGEAGVSFTLGAIALGNDVRVQQWSSNSQSQTPWELMSRHPAKRPKEQRASMENILRRMVKSFSKDPRRARAFEPPAERRSAAAWRPYGEWGEDR